MSTDEHADAPSAAGRQLTVRPDADTKDLMRASNKERGLLAAKAVLSGELALAQKQFMVSWDTLNHYRKHLRSCGMPDLSTPGDASAVQRAQSSCQKSSAMHQLVGPSCTGVSPSSITIWCPSYREANIT